MLGNIPKLSGDGTAVNNALKSALAKIGSSLRRAKAHASANRVGSLSAEDKSYLSSKQATCNAEARLECETL